MTNTSDTKKPHLVGELERLGPDERDAMVLAVDAPGFDQLTPRQRILAYYLYRAAIPGNRIAFDQSHRFALELRDLFESIYLHSDGMDTTLRASVHDYLKYVWIHHGQYDHYNHTKFSPNTLTPAGFRSACEHAKAQGAPIPVDGKESLDDMLARLEPHIFDESFEPLQTNQSEGDDIVATSWINYFGPDITSADLESLDPSVKNKLNSRVDRQGGELVAETFKIGGRYSAELTVISHFLGLAADVAETQQQKKSLQTLIQYYRDGDEETFRAHCVDWLASDTEVDYLNGFIEVYLDPRGIVGQFEANVSFKADAGIIGAISENAEYFEARMPWPDQYKRDKITTPVANVVNVLIETGDAGPVSPAAYNLPNYNDIRRDHGSKNVILHNIESTWSRPLLQEVADVFFLPEYRNNIMKYSRTIVRPLEVYMHEIIGHGSGKPDETLTEDPRTVLARVYSSLEECRADLVALYHMADPKLVELNAFALAEQRDIVETAYITYLQGWFARLDRVPGMQVREAHNKGHHCILNYILEGGGEGIDYGAELIEQDDNLYIRINDLELVRSGFGELLSRLQVIKSTGNRKDAEALFDRYGTSINPEWKANVEKRRHLLTSPKTKAFVFPHLTPVVESGQIVDVRLCHDEDLTAQQLRFSRIELSEELIAD